MDKKVFRFIGLLILLCTFIPAKLAHHFYYKNKTFIKNAHIVTGTLTELEKSDSDDDMFFPVYSYLNENGDTLTLKPYFSQNNPGSIGDTIEIYFDPLHPDSAKFNSFWSLWFIPLLLALSALIPLFFGMVFLVVIPLFIGNPSPAATHNFPPADDSSPPVAKDNEKTWAILMHVSSFAGLLGIPLGNIFGPLTVWLIKRDESPALDQHGRNALNFQLSITLYSIISLFLCLILIGIVLLAALFVTGFICSCIAAINADKGRVYHYPFTINFFRSDHLLQRETVSNYSNHSNAL